MGEQRPLWSCRNQDCAVEITYHDDMLREHPEGGPVCVECFDAESPRTNFDNLPLTQSEWHELPNWISPTSAEIERLRALTQWRPIDTGAEKVPAIEMYSSEFIDLDFNPSGILLGGFTGEVFEAAVWCNCCDKFHTRYVKPTYYRIPAPPEGEA